MHSTSPQTDDSEASLRLDIRMANPRPQIQLPRNEATALSIASTLQVHPSPSKEQRQDDTASSTHVCIEPTAAQKDKGMFSGLVFRI